jgi:hypothetical protein
MTNTTLDLHTEESSIYSHHSGAVSFPSVFRFLGYLKREEIKIRSSVNERSQGDKQNGIFWTLQVLQLSHRQDIEYLVSLEVLSTSQKREFVSLASKTLEWLRIRVPNSVTCSGMHPIEWFERACHSSNQECRHHCTKRKTVNQKSPPNN